MDDTIEEFTIHVPDAVPADLHERVARTHWSEALHGAGWGDGVDVRFLRDLVTYWRVGFD